MCEDSASDTGMLDYYIILFEMLDLSDQEDHVSFRGHQTNHSNKHNIMDEAFQWVLKKILGLNKEALRVETTNLIVCFIGATRATDPKHK
jgi:hypothetical protein